MDRESKNHIVTFRVPLSEYEMIKKAAEREKLSVSDYVRLTILMDFALFSNRAFAWKTLARNMIHKAVEQFDNKLYQLSERADKKRPDRLYEQIMMGFKDT